MRWTGVTGWWRSAQAAAIRDCADAALAAADPGDAGYPANWPRWAQLMPHLLAANPAATSNPALNKATLQAPSGRILRRMGSPLTGYEAFMADGPASPAWEAVDLINATHTGATCWFTARPC